MAAMLFALAGLCAACSPLSGSTRLAPSLLGCTRAAVARAVTPSMSDKLAHCLAAAAIARGCSVSEARLAAYGKEVRDLFSRGRAEAADLRASRTGIDCARRYPDAAAIPACCAPGAN